MPPVMLTPEEIEAVLLGVQMVPNLGDAAIINAARDVILKKYRATFTSINSAAGLGLHLCWCRQSLSWARICVE
jgi:predicted DNA-binding transcriptional regulator YafY